MEPNLIFYMFKHPLPLVLSNFLKYFDMLVGSNGIKWFVMAILVFTTKLFKLLGSASSISSSDFFSLCWHQGLRGQSKDDDQNKAVHLVRLDADLFMVRYEIFSNYRNSLHIQRLVIFVEEDFQWMLFDVTVAVSWYILLADDSRILAWHPKKVSTYSHS